MKNKKDGRNNGERYTGPKKFNFRLLFILVCNTILIFSIYRIGVHYEFVPMIWIYFGVTFALSLAYIIYNRGLSRRNITPDMLPDNWSAVEKQKFFDEDKAWREKSKWMLTIIIPLIFTFMFEMIDLYFIDYFKNLFPSMF
mgnify:CR=1 FL=1